MSGTKPAVFLSVALAGAGAVAASRASGGDLPRYRLEPGMELSYKGSSTFRHQKGVFVDEQEVTAWVVRRNADGSVRVVVRQGDRSTATSLADTVRSLFRKKAQEPLKYSVGYYDLFDDGRVGGDSELAFRIAPALLFPRLPRDEAGARAGWTGRDEPLVQEYRYRDLQDEPEGWTFRGVRVGPEKPVYGMSWEMTFHLDRPRGVLRRIDETFTQDYGFKGTGTGATELRSIERRDAAWLAAFAPAADRYFAAIKAYEQASNDAEKEADRARALLDAARDRLRSARDAIDQPDLRAQLDRKLAEHDAVARYRVDNARRRADLVGKPAPPWELTGLDGKTHSLADYRGKVVLLDFWYRGCGWCIKAMPQLNALAHEFAGRPVALLGMNTDGDQADARVVVDALALKYPTLRAREIPEKYGVQTFPTLILIDPEGTVRDVHVGFSPTLRTDVAREIEKLLIRNKK